MPYFVVTSDRGAAWDWARPMRQQDAWTEHADFMDRLTAEGFVALGGTLGEGRATGALLIVRSDSAGSVRARLESDPWTRSGHLVVRSIEPWTVLLGTLDHRT